MRKRSLVEAISLLALMLSVAAFGAELVSVNDKGTDGGIDPSSIAAISGDGRYVVFLSRSHDLVQGVSFSGTLNVFVRDLLAETTQLVSVNRLNSAGANADCRQATISRNGQFVAFVTSATDIVLNDNNRRDDVFVRDLVVGKTILASVNKLGSSSGNDFSDSPSISADGRFVAFVSAATDLLVGAPLDNNRANDVFVRDLVEGKTILASVNKLGSSSANGASANPMISPNGSNVVFTSWATDLTLIPDGNNASDVFLHNIPANTNLHVSVNFLGSSAANGASDHAMVDFTGAAIVFSSSASDLVFFDHNNAEDVFVRKGTQMIAVSINRFGTATGNGPSSGGVIDDAGTTVAFQSDASDLVLNDLNEATDVFVRDLSARTPVLISGNYLDGTSARGPSTNPKISGNGARVVFESLAENLVVNDNNRVNDLFARALSSRTNQLITVDRLFATSANGPSSSPLISVNGLLVAFESVATDLTLLSPTAVPQVYATCFAGSRFCTTPALTIQRQDGSIVISWTADLQGYRLESSPSGTRDWNPVSTAPALVNGQYVVTLSGRDGLQFYRLASR